MISSFVLWRIQKAAAEDWKTEGWQQKTIDQCSVSASRKSSTLIDLSWKSSLRVTTVLVGADCELRQGKCGDSNVLIGLMLPT